MPRQVRHKLGLQHVSGLFVIHAQDRHVIHSAPIAVVHPARRHRRRRPFHETRIRGRRPGRHGGIGHHQPPAAAAENDILGSWSNRRLIRLRWPEQEEVVDRGMSVICDTGSR